VRDDGGWTDQEEAHFWTVGGMSVLPSGFDEIHPPPYRPYPSAAYAWLCGVLGMALIFPSVIGVVIAVRAGSRGNRWAWLAALFCVTTAVLSWIMWSHVTGPVGVTVGVLAPQS
jgi:hypothetical protein